MSTPIRQTLREADIRHSQIQEIGSNTHTQIDSHLANTSNPHNVTAAQVGSGIAQWNASYLQNSYFYPILSSGGILTYDGYQIHNKTLSVGSNGTDFNYSYDGTNHTINLPAASNTSAGKVTTGTQSFSGIKTFTSKAYFTDGTSLAPTIAFASDPDVGFFKSSLTSIGVSSGISFRVDKTFAFGLTTTGRHFTYNHTSDILSVVIGGTVLELTSSGLFTEKKIYSTVGGGSSPFEVSSTVLNTNLNADLLDGLHSASFSPTAGSQSINTVGTIATGVWNGTVIPVAYGGTATSSTFPSGSIIFAGGAGQYQSSSGNLFFNQQNLNLGFGTSSFGTNARRVWAIASGAAPTTSPADTVQLWCADRGGTANKAGLHIRSEDGTSHVFSDNVGLGTTTPLCKLAVGAGSINDGNVPIQISTAGAGTEAWFGINKNGGYGFIFGYRQAVAGFNGGFMRQVATGDNFYFYHDDVGLVGQMFSTGGWVFGGATGGDKGFGTINAKAVYDDNTLLTDYILEKFVDGKVKKENLSTKTVTRYNNTSKKIEPVSVTTYNNSNIELSDKEVAKIRQLEKDDVELLTIDETEAYIRQNRHLPSIIGRDEWRIKGRPSTGEIITQLWETIERQQIHIIELNNRLKALENVASG